MSLLQARLIELNLPINVEVGTRDVRGPERQRPGVSAYENICPMMLEIGVALTTERALRRPLHLMKPELPGARRRASRQENSARPSFGVVLQDAMKRAAVFGNAGGGKSTLARQLTEITRLPLYVLDELQFKEGGAAVPHDEYLELHRDLLAQETWIIDGYGDNTTIWERFGAADTLVYVDLSLPIHYWRVTKRLIKGLVC